MLNNFIYAETKDLFLEQLNAGNILDEAIVFIKDTREIWNHGTYFKCHADISDGMSDEEIRNIVETETQRAQQVESDIISKLQILIGTDAWDSIRNIIKDELDTQLRSDDISESFDTIKEIAEYLSNNPSIAIEVEKSIKWLQENKADKATTLAGYGITDALTKSGGTISGSIGALNIYRDTNNPSGIKFSNTEGVLGYIGVNSLEQPVFYASALKDVCYIFHTGNYTDYVYTISDADNKFVTKENAAVKGDKSWNILTVRNTADSNAYIGFSGKLNDAATTIGYIGFNKNGNPTYMTADGANSYRLINENNYETTTDKRYLKLDGGGTILVNDYVALALNRKSTGGAPFIKYSNNTGTLGIIGFSINKNPIIYIGDDTQTPIYLLHSNNFNDYALPITGGDISGEDTSPLRINNTGSEGQIVMIARYKSNAKTSIGWSTSKGSYIYNYTSAGRLGITDAGVPYYNDNELIHAGNYTNYVLTKDSNVASATKLQTARTIWGNSFDGSGNINKDPIYINNTAQWFQDSDGTKINTLYLDTGNNLYLGKGTVAKNYTTFIAGNSIKFVTDNSFATRVMISNNGNVLIGTTTESEAKLQVAGDVQISGNLIPDVNYTRTLGTASLGFSRTYTRYIDTVGNYNLKLCTGGIERISIGGESGIVIINNRTTFNDTLTSEKDIVLNNNSNIYFKNSEKASVPLITLNLGNVFALGYGNIAKSYITSIFGRNIRFYYTENDMSFYVSENGNAIFNNNLYLNQGSNLYLKDYSDKGNYLNAFYLGSDNFLRIGQGLTLFDYSTKLYGKSITFLFGEEYTEGVILNSNGVVTINNKLYQKDNIYVENNKVISFYDSNGNSVNALTMNESNTLTLGYGNAAKGYNTNIYGNNINIATNINGTLQTSIQIVNGTINLLQGSLLMNNGKSINLKDNAGDSSSFIHVLYLTSANQLYIGRGCIEKSYDTSIFGNNVTVYAKNDSSVTSVVTFKQNGAQFYKNTYIGTDNSDSTKLYVYGTAVVGQTNATDAVFLKVRSTNGELGVVVRENGYKCLFDYNYSRAIIEVRTDGNTYTTIGDLYTTNGNIISNYAGYFTTGLYVDKNVVLHEGNYIDYIGTSSDRRLKSNIASITDSEMLRVLSQLNPVTFTWNTIATDLKSTLHGESSGFIADEYEVVIPNSGFDMWDKQYRGIDYTRVSSYLVAGWQNHERRIEAVEDKTSEIDQLKKLLEAASKKISELEAQLNNN